MLSPARFLLLVVLLPFVAPAADLRTRNVVLITIDGLRWQEMFRGADETLLNKEHGGVPDNQLAALRADFGADTPQERRAKLMPFLWGTIAKEGQVFGNRDLNSPVTVENPQWVSYPGYNEILTGATSSVIVTNSPIPNPHVTVLEWLNQRPRFRGKVAACAEWRVFQSILNPARSGMFVWTTRQPAAPEFATPRLREIEAWMADMAPMSPDEHFDVFVYQAARDTFAQRSPRVFLFALGEPDAWAHGRRYDRVLWSIQRCDKFIRELWETLQARRQYRGRTTFLITPDHGRGIELADWTSHGTRIPRSNETWFAALGPDTAAKGERRDTPELKQTQIAATVAALLGEDFRAAFPQAAPPIAEVMGR